MKVNSPDYPYKRNPLTLDDVALACSVRWCVAEKSAMKYLRERFTDAGDALDHLRENVFPPDSFWESL